MRRVLIHGQSGALSNHTLEPGLPVPLRGQCLIDIEFLARFGHGGTCLYTQSPPHINLITTLFPHLRFIAFTTDYDPAMPCLTPGLETNGNLTRSTFPFTKETARDLGNRGSDEPLLFISAGTESTQSKLLYHALARPNSSLFRLDSIPADFLDGEILYPLYASPSSSTAYMVVGGHTRAKVYDPSLLAEELSYFHVCLRSSGNYDRDAKRDILALYNQTRQHTTAWMQQDIAWLLPSLAETQHE